MKNAIILHGTSSNSQANWFPWLKQELEKRGYSVWVPDLPGADYPDMETYTTFLLKNAPPVIHETILIGHSSGAIAVLGFLQALPQDTHIKEAYLVAGFKDNLSWIDKKGKHVLGGLFKNDIDYKTISKKADKIFIIHSDNDPYCPMSHASYLSIKLNGEVVYLPQQKHFSTETTGDKYREFPFLLDLIETSSVHEALLKQENAALPE